jgi:hypothetical protein
MSEHIYLLTIGLPLATVLLIFGMRYFAAVQQAKARLADDDNYRAIAAKTAAAQADCVHTLAAVNAALADLQTRLAKVEMILKQVE